MQEAFGSPIARMIARKIGYKSASAPIPGDAGHDDAVVEDHAVNANPKTR